MNISSHLVGALDPKTYDLTPILGSCEVYTQRCVHFVYFRFGHLQFFISTDFRGTFQNGTPSNVKSYVELLAFLSVF